MKRNKSYLRYVFAIILMSIAVAILWYSHELMTWLIHIVGEERALGPDHVIRESGNVLLTNPGGMLFWTLPFYGLSLFLLITAVVIVFVTNKKPSPH